MDRAQLVQALYDATATRRAMRDQLDATLDALTRAMVGRAADAPTMIMAQEAATQASVNADAAYYEALAALLGHDYPDAVA